MSVGRDRADWKQTAALLAQIVNVQMADANDRHSFDHYDPYREEHEEQLERVPIEALQVFLPPEARNALNQPG